MKFTEKQADEIMGVIEGAIGNGMDDYIGKRELRSFMNVYNKLSTSTEVVIGPLARTLLIERLHMGLEAGDCGYYDLTIIKEILEKLQGGDLNE